MKFSPRRWFDRTHAVRSTVVLAEPMAALVPALVATSVAALVAFSLALGLVAPAAAQPAPLADPPGRVARLSDVVGQVWLYSPDTGDWVSAVRNRPLTSGDRLATDAGARAELQVGATTLRLAAGTELEVRLLDDDHLSLQLHSGGVAVRLREPADAAGFELATDDGRFLTPRAGRYRFDRDTTGSFVTVQAGQARYEGPNSGLAVGAGQRAEFWIDAAGGAQYRLGVPQNDAFSAWNDERDRVADRRASVRYVSPAMTGAEDLDRYGRWEQDADYGALWVPTVVAVGWAPYSTGHWAWVRPWGWTWVDDAPWGFAPFHYGRWVQRREVWCWSPGQRVDRPVYAPALVGWVGGPGVSVSISIGGGRAPAPVVGWFPLAPREVYVPSYRASPRYAQNINITNVSNVTQITTVINNPQAPREFWNRRSPNAVTVVPEAVMTSRQPVAPAAAQLRDAPWVRDIARQPAGAAVLIAAPVTAPLLPARRPEGRDGRDGRDGREGRDGRPMAPVAGAAAPQGGSPGEGRPNQPPRFRDGTRPMPAAPTATMPAAPTLPTPPTASTVPAPPNDARPDRRFSGPRDEARPDLASPRAPQATIPAKPLAPAATVQEAPLMRALPVNRGEERRGEERRGEVRPLEERRPPVRAEAPAAIEPGQVAPPVRAVVRPQPADVTRPTTAPVAVPPPPSATRPPPLPLAAPTAARPVEAARAALPPPQAVPEARRPEAPARPRSEPPKEVREERRDDKRAEPRERDMR